MTKRLETPEGYLRAVLELGGERVQFFQIAGEAPAPHPHWAEHVAVEVSGLERLLQTLLAAGYPPSRPLQLSPGGRQMAFVRDPDGRSVELLGAALPSSSPKVKTQGKNLLALTHKLHLV